MRRKETAQMEFNIGADNSLTAMTQIATSPEQEQRAQRLVTFSDIERVIYRDIEKVPPRNTFDVSAIIGAGIDWFLVPANFIYRFRDNYCFSEELYPDWNLKEVFSKFYPTGWGWEKYLHILEDHRKDFVENNPLYPANFALERGNIKRALIPIWKNVAKKFRIDSLEIQQIMVNQGDLLLLSGKPATTETVGEIGQRIVRERFDVLVDDDKNYTYLAKPDCLLVYELDGQTFHIQVQPDYIKRLREKRKSVKKRQIIVKRIVGDFKDSDRKDLTDFSTPFGKVMLVYNWLLSQAGQRLKMNQLTWVRLSNRQLRRVFLIPQDVVKPVPLDNVETGLEFLQEKNGDIFSPMPKLSQEEETIAKDLLEQALRKSREVRI